MTTFVLFKQHPVTIFGGISRFKEFFAPTKTIVIGHVEITNINPYQGRAVEFSCSLERAGNQYLILNKVKIGNLENLRCLEDMILEAGDKLLSRTTYEDDRLNAFISFRELQE